MSYTSYDLLVSRYPALKNWAATPSEVNSGLIHYAEAELNGMLAPGFTVPFTESYPMITDLTHDLAYYKGMLTKVEPGVLDRLKKNIDNRVKDLLDHKVYLISTAGTIIEAGTTGSGVWSTTMDHHATHSMLDPEDDHTMISSGALYDAEQERE